MEVTQNNFQEVLTELDEVLDNATFLSIDGEFTGLNSGPDASAFDTPTQYYTKLRSGSMDFLLVQFGLSVFTFNHDSGRYSQRSYNFYAFPRPYNRSSPDCRFLCQASSITFLANQGFDFNKLFKEGIPYLTKAEEDKLIKRMEEKQKMREDSTLDIIPLSDDDRPIIEEIFTKIENFLNSELEEFRIDRCNAYIRRLVYQEVKSRYPTRIRVEGKNENGNQYIIVYKMGSKEEEDKKEAERKEKEKLEVKEAIGLSALLKKIADSGKLIVGHNMLFDLCHIIHQFFAPLPESYTEFKSLVHALFPRLLDTKIVCQSNQFKDSVPSILGQLLETIKSPPFSVPELHDIPGRSYSLEEEKLHVAGYDAFITGLCFLTLCQRLGSLQIPEVAEVLPDSPLLYPYINKLLIARLKDYPHIDLVGKDPSPARDHVFHITFPKDWKLSDLSQIFMPYGGAYISWLSDTTAYIGLHKREQAKFVVKELLKGKKAYNLQKYAEHQAFLNSKKNLSSSEQRKRKISEGGSSSPPSLEKSQSSSRCSSNGNNGQDNVGGDDGEGWQVALGNSKYLRKKTDNRNVRLRKPFNRGSNSSCFGNKRYLAKSPIYEEDRAEKSSSTTFSDTVIMIVGLLGILLVCYLMELWNRRSRNK